MTRLFEPNGFGVLKVKDCGEEDMADLKESEEKDRARKVLGKEINLLIPVDKKKMSAFSF